jgi:hypothetical protein
MQVYKVGEPFPGEHPLPGEDFTVAQLNQKFFDIKAYLSDIKPKEEQQWRRGKIKYGVYVNSDIPFFIIDFDNNSWNIDVNINILKIKDAHQLDNWLNDDSNVINLFLINTESNILIAMRMISIRMDICEKIRDILEKQSHTYGSHEEAELKIAAIQHSITTQEMIKRAQMIAL